jgi:hypothetical protein
MEKPSKTLMLQNLAILKLKVSKPLMIIARNNLILISKMTSIKLIYMMTFLKVTALIKGLI